MQKHEEIYQTICGGHSGVCERMDRAERDIQKLFSGIDKMKTWVICGMGALILQFVAFILSIALPHSITGK